LEILKALVVSGELDRVFENVTSSTNEKLRQLTGVVTDERTKIKAQEAMVEITFSVFRRSISDEYCDVLTAYAQLENAHKLGMEEYVQMKVDFLRFLNRELKKSAEARDEKLRENLLRLRERVQSGGLDADESLM
jgi:hypothetical protein